MRNSQCNHSAISEEFDRKLLRWMTDGQTEEIVKLSSKDLLDHGEIELRNWIIVLDDVASARLEILAYEPLYRGLMGMGGPVGGRELHLRG